MITVNFHIKIDNFLINYKYLKMDNIFLHKINFFK